jgi:murein DD-endopeptidase MepM/ murein hydrolase activator NlpD
VFPVEADIAHISYGRYHHDYPATDIFCPIESRFVAPTDGIVDYVSTEDHWDPKTDIPADRGGLAVAIVGSDGIRYYGSHLSQIAEGITAGVHVTTGQLLGLTGRSGNARGTLAHLHFGISQPTTPDDWQVRRGQISPYPYLRAWQRGENLKPVFG